jgi:hypothetical protein
MNPDFPRPKAHLVTASKRYPGAWKQYDVFRQGRGSTGFPGWPDWCFCPLAGAYAIVSGGGDNRIPTQHIGEVARLGALAAWRVSQGIYRFDDDLRASLLATSLSGDLPCEVLYRLPEWCVYIETPGRSWDGVALYGFFAHLESDANNGREELRLLLDHDDELIPVPIHLGSWPLTEAIARALDLSKTHAVSIGETIPAGVKVEIEQVISPLISLLLYLCADEAEIGTGDDRPKMPKPTKTKQGQRLFPPDSPKTWEVGVRIGAALRRAQAQAGAPSGEVGTHARPRAHIRRAHWHTYRVGAGRSDRRLKWLPPIPINVFDAELLPAVIKNVF